MKKISILISVFTFLSVSIIAQDDQISGLNQAQIEVMEQQLLLNAQKSEEGYIRCFTDEVDAMMRSQNPNMETRAEYEERIAAEIERITKNGLSSHKTVYNIPVIVHVVHNGDIQGIAENLKAAQVQSQIDVLNEDYRKMAGTNGDGNGVDVEINFCPALVDPFGNPLAEPGVHRYNGGQASWMPTNIDNTLKPATSWNPNNYFNIWTVNFNQSAGLLGYATYPGTSAANKDGVVVGFNYFGSVQKGTGFSLTSPYNLGRTATHEVGHALGLLHTFQGGCTNSNCASQGDFCCDTPPVDNANYGCPTGHISCGSADLIENYMDYSNDACMDMFTANQKTRMVAVMGSQPRRASLNSSTVCNANSIDESYFSSSIRVFPNPTNASVNISFTKQNIISIEIIDMLGKIIHSEQPINTQLVSIDMSNNPNGVYFVNINSSKETATKKIILAK